MSIRRWRQEWKYLLVAQVQRFLDGQDTARRSRRLFLPQECQELPPSPILVFAPHADDETLGPGGAIAKFVKAGLKVEVVVVTDAAKGLPDAADHGEKASRVRREEAEKARKCLGLEPFEWLDFPDQDVPSAAVMRDKFAEVIQAKKPETILTPFPVDFHRDHRLCTEAVQLATEQLLWQGPIWLYECSAPIYPNILVDITETAEAKADAMRAYASQMATNDYVEAIVYGLNKYRSYGLLAGKGHAEAFFVTEPSFLKEFLREVPREV